MSRKTLSSQIQERNLIKIKIDDLKFDKTNPNRLTQEQMSGLRQSMKRFGYLTPIVIDQHNNIADGEHRALVYKEYGIKEIPAFKLNLKHDSERRILRQIMNKLHGEHERQLDADELVQIFKAGKLDDLTQLIAQQKEDLQRAMLRYHPQLDFVTPENQDEIDKLIDEELKRIVPDTKLGDVYQLGDHRLVCGDCTDERIRRKLFDEIRPDIILTDPPYSSGGFQEAGKASGSIGTRENASIRNDVLSTRGYQNLIHESLNDINADTLYMFTDWRMWCHSFDVAERCGFGVRGMIVWDKMSFGMGYPWRSQHELILYAKRSSNTDKQDSGVLQTKGNVLQSKRTGNINHPVEKPTDLLTQILRNTTKGTVYDPFIGSGSTLIACEQIKSKCFACEIDPHYCDIIVKRWEGYTNKKAVKIKSK